MGITKHHLEADDLHNILQSVTFLTHVSYNRKFEIRKEF